ncbi:MAG: hypothetical protein DRN90_03305 [Thermoproteota archaeon]|nr:MAG: hypothetical protein DRN90_03305 [Candidatus Korarchaeota archaeon]
MRHDISIRIGFDPDRFGRNFWDRVALATNIVCSKLQGEIMQEAPKGATKALYRSVGFHVTKSRGVRAKVGVMVKYAEPVERGSRPHMPPVAPIELWVRRKLGKSRPQSQRIAWAIAQTIRRRGTQAQEFVKRVYERRAHHIGPTIMSLVRRM